MKEKQKILHLTGSLSIGGAQRLILGLAQYTGRTDIEMHIFSFGKISKDSFLPDLQALDDLFLVLRPTSTLYDPRNVLFIVRYIRQNQIDILQTHMMDADIIGGIAGRLAGIPVISTLHNEPQNYDRHRFDRRWLAHVTARYLTTHFVAVSKHIRKLFVEEWKIPEQKISAINNGVVLDNLLLIEDGTKATDSRITVTNIASLSTQKAQHLLLEAAKIVLVEHPTTRFMIVGRGSLEESLKKKTAKLGISDQVIFTGVRRDIPDILAQTDIFVLSSLWEGLPLTAIEAMAAARPVVLTDVGGIKELVLSGIHGLIVPPGDVPALADSLISLIKNKPQRLEMGRAAREQVRHKFSIERNIKQYQALYKLLLD